MEDNKLPKLYTTPYQKIPESITTTTTFLPDPPDILAPLLPETIIDDKEVNSMEIMSGKEKYQPAPPNWNPPPIPNTTSDNEMEARNIRDPSEGLYEEPEGIYHKDSTYKKQPSSSDNINQSSNEMHFSPLKTNNSTNKNCNDSKENEKTSNNTEYNLDVDSVYVRKTNRGTYFIQPSNVKTSTSTLSPEINRYEKTCIGFLNGPTITHKVIMPNNGNPMYKSQQSTNFNTNIIYDPPTSSSPLMYSTEESTATSISENFKGTCKQQSTTFFPTSRESKILNKKHGNILPNEYISGEYNKIQTKESYISRMNFRNISLALAISLIVSLIIIIYLLLSTTNDNINRYTVYDPSLHSIYPKHKQIDIGYKNGVVVPLPHIFSIGEIVRADLPPGRISYTSFDVPKDSPVNFNISVKSTARIVMYSRQTTYPTPAINDFRNVILADRLHLNLETTEFEKNRKPRSDQKKYALRTTLISQFLLSGKWYIGFLNDGDQVQPITFIVTVSSHYNGPFDSPYFGENSQLLNDNRDSCKFNCFGKGDCKDSKCLCHPGFSGLYCQETSCPVLCSGNGIFSNGKCICHNGYKGYDCDMPSSWCEVPNCNNNGYCNSNGICECKEGWTGAFCNEKVCENNCNDRGICKEGKCYCENGYFSSDCSKNVRDIGNLKINNYQEEKLVKNKNNNINNNYGNKAALTNKNEDNDTSSLCNFRGIYNKTQSSCICSPGYKGRRCEEVGCSINCGEHGKCTSNNICICEDSYEGEYCERKSCLHECNINGECDGNGRCICKIGWNGENCLIDGCKNNCNGNGECKQNENNNEYKCYCNDSYHGEFCEYQKEYKCDDGIDNDNDGLKDCEDPDCCGTSHCIDEGLCPNIPKPSVVAKRLSNGHGNFKSFFNKHKFLISPNSIQYYSQESSFIHNQVSIVRGRVLSHKAGPLSGVRISDEIDPKHGFTLTRTGNETGIFDLMVNGGNIVSLRFMRTPFERVYKNIFIRPNEIIHIGDIYMDDKIIKNENEISPRCKDIIFYHSIEPIAIPFWKLNEHSSYPNNDNHQNPVLFAESRTLFDSIPIHGTSIKLIYSSESTSYSRIFLQLVGSRYPLDLHLIHLYITVAGKEYSTILSVKQNLNYIFYWDKNSIYNEPIYGLTTAIISVGYQYKDCTNSIIWKKLQISVEGHPLRKKSISFGGWLINNNHYYDYTNNILEKGDGKRYIVNEEQRGIHIVTGGNKKREIKCSFCGKQKIDEVLLYEPRSLAIGKNGQLFIGDFNMIRNINLKDGIATPILEFNVDDISHNYYMVYNQVTGNLIISIPLKKQIIEISDFDEEIDLKKLTSNYDVIAGNGNSCPPEDLCGDDGLAEDAQLTYPKGIIVDSDGIIYFLDSRKLRKIEKDGIIKSLVTEKQQLKNDNCQDIFKFDDLEFIWPTSIAIDYLTEDLYILDSDIIYKLNLKNKIANIFAGQNKKCPNEKNKNNIVLSNVKYITISQHERRIYYIEEDDKSGTVIKSLSINHDYGDDLIIVSGTKGTTIPNHLAFNKVSSIIFDEKNELYVSDEGNSQIKKLSPIKAKFDDEKKVYKINNQESNEIYYFDKNGRHIYTLDLITGTEKVAFEYNLDTSEIDKITTSEDGILEFNTNSKGERIMTSNKGFMTIFNIKKCGKYKCLEEIINPDKTTVTLKYNKESSLISRTYDSKTWIFKYNKNYPSTINDIISPSGQNYSIDQQLLKDNNFITEVLLNGQLFTKITVHANQPEYINLSNQETIIQTDDKKSNFIKFKDGFTIANGEGLTSQYDRRSHPLLQENENMVLKRKLVLRSIDSKKEITSKSEWKTFIKRSTTNNIESSPSKLIEVIGGRPKVNGHTLFIIEFNRTIFSDIIKNIYDHILFTISYNMERKIISVIPRNNINNENIIPTFKKEYLKNSNLLKRKLFGNFSINYLYDLRDRLMTITYSKNNLLIKRLGYSSKDTDISYKPTMIQLSNGNKYLWRYDKEGNVISLKSPGGITEEIHKFWRVYGGIKNDYLRYYRSFPFLRNNHLLKENNKDINKNFDINKIDKFLLILDGNEKVSSYMTPDHEKSLFIKRDIYGKIENINIDGRCYIYKYFKNLKDNRLMDITIYGGDEIIQKKYSYIGFLVNEVNETRGNNIITLEYDYDPFLRPISEIFKLNGNIISNEIINYESEYGKIIENESDVFKKIKKMNENYLPIEENFILYKKDFIKVKYFYDEIGRVIKKEWFMRNDKYLSEKKEFGINGKLVYYMLKGNEEKKEWRLYYDINERIRQINEKLIEKENGIVKKFNDMEYIRDKNGFIIKRGDWNFKYDVLGRLLGGKKDNLEIWYNYDNNGYIISKVIKKNNKIIDGIEFFYNKDGKLKFIWNTKDKDDIWNINYNKESGEIKSIVQNDDSYFIVTDNEKSIRYIVGNHGELIYEINYTPTGKSLRDKKPRPFILPIGFKGLIEDIDMNIVFVKEYSELLNLIILRPLDVYTGRFLSTSINVMNPKINLLTPEIISDPFGYNFDEHMKSFKFSLLDWLKYSGYDLSFIKYHFTKNINLHNECSSSKIILSSYICEGIQSTNTLNNILSINDKTIEAEDKFISKAFGNEFIKNSNFDITIIEKQNGYVNILRKNDHENLSFDILEKILTGSRYLPISSEMILNDSFIIMHFVKHNHSYIEKDEFLCKKISHIVQVNFLGEIKVLEFIINDRVFKVYYSNDMENVRENLRKEFYKKMIDLKWESEKSAIKNGLHFLSKNWTFEEIKEMFQKGRVKDVKSKLKVSSKYKYLPSSLDNWYFE
ncbi:Teneurin-3 [Strongyloides ratti]|uniref:Teneurin-3 n=1 Tax=Strongyloides ratti TaxID=34506 RepID=A0A090LBY6_STRRB|nr:Teneurin-3 [Strongyloides ratti]CEF67291.1 Teneurin-3 [Strongyloides ratti]